MLTKTEVLAEALILCDTLPKQTVAKQLFEQYPQYFESREAARCALRWRTGAQGSESRNAYADNRSSIEEGLRLLEASKPKEYPIRIGECRALVISDLHIPHHDTPALMTALECGLEWGADTIVFNGDVLDCYSVSHFNRDPNHIRLPEEFLRANMVLDMIDDIFPDARKVFKFGNHEMRLKSYIQSSAKELDGLKGLSVEGQLLLEERGYEWLISKPVVLGKLHVLHGHELSRGPFVPALPARTALLKTSGSVMVGHHHRTSEIIKGTISGDYQGGWSTGCLCNMDPDYNPTAALDWNHGFALVEVDDDLSFTVTNKRIINGRVH